MIYCLLFASVPISSYVNAAKPVLKSSVVFKNPTTLLSEGSDITGGISTGPVRPYSTKFMAVGGLLPDRPLKSVEEEMSTPSLEAASNRKLSITL